MIKDIITDIKADFQIIPNEVSDYKKFGILVGIIVLGIGFLGFRKDAEWYPYTVLTGTTLFFFGLVFPQLLQPVYHMWMKFAVILGFFMSRVILSVVFFGLLTPIAIVARLTGKQFLDLSIHEKTYWRTRTQRHIKKRYEKQY